MKENTWQRANIRKAYRLRKKSCLADMEKEEVIDMLYKYEEYLVWDEIGTCPNIEVEIDVTDKSHSLLDLTI